MIICIFANKNDNIIDRTMNIRLEQTKDFREVENLTRVCDGGRQ